MNARFLFFLPVAILCSGCLSVRSTDGIKAYLQDQGRAEIRAIDIKDKVKDTKSVEYVEAENKFNEASGTGNGWVAGIIADAELKDVLDVNADAYASSDTKKRIDAFMAVKYSNTSIHPLFDPATGVVVAGFAVTIIKDIISLNDEFTAKAIANLKTVMARAEWTTFNKTTAEWVSKKYHLGQ